MWFDLLLFLFLSPFYFQCCWVMPPGLWMYTLFCSSLSCLSTDVMMIFSPCTSYSELLNSSLAGFINALPAPTSFPPLPLSQTSVCSYDCSFFALDSSLSCPWQPSWLSVFSSPLFCSSYPSCLPTLCPSPSPPLLCCVQLLVSFADWWFLIGSGHFSFKCLGAFCSSS